MRGGEPGSHTGHPGDIARRCGSGHPTPSATVMLHGWAFEAGDRSVLCCPEAPTLPR